MDSTTFGWKVYLKRVGMVLYFFHDHPCLCVSVILRENPVVVNLILIMCINSVIIQGIRIKIYRPTPELILVSKYVWILGRFEDGCLHSRNSYNLKRLRIMFCIVLYWRGGNCCLNALRPFQIYCAPPNLGITMTWICRIKFCSEAYFFRLEIL